MKDDGGDESLFDSRPALEPETCPCCRGSGTRARSYALRHSAHPNLADERDAGSVTAKPAPWAAGIFDCCREAAEVADRAGRRVVFWFNGVLVVVPSGCEDGGDGAAREWWRVAFGETPEETAARR